MSGKARPVRVLQNKLGFFEVANKPTRDELSAHYRNRYYGGDQANSQYAKPYSAEELSHKFIAVAEALEYVDGPAGKALEIGVGEGFFLEGLRGNGWQVEGVDFTSDGFLMYNPRLQPFVEIGDALEYLDRVDAQSKTFDVIACNHVIEHVIDPLAALDKIRRLLAPRGICRIAVPNDGSWLQHQAVERGYAERDFWISPPEHLNYFTVDSLRHTLANHGFEIVEMLTDFPIDIFLFNPDSNYMQDRSRGRNCHFARTAFETALYERGIGQVIEFRRACAKVGLGRCIIAYCRAQTVPTQAHAR